MVGLTFEAWFALIWTITYDMFSVKEALDVTGILFFCRGIATLVIPIFQSLILDATKSGSSDFHESNAKDSTTSAADIDHGFTVNTEADHDSPSVNVTSGMKVESYSKRSFGNQMVMVMLCTLLTVSTVIQVIMFIAGFVTRNEEDRNEESGKEQNKRQGEELPSETSAHVNIAYE